MILMPPFYHFSLFEGPNYIGMIYNFKWRHERITARLCLSLSGYRFDMYQFIATVLN